MNFVKYLVGEYLGVYIVWATDKGVRRSGASGGVATALLKFLLDYRHVDAVLVPRPRFSRDLVYGVWTVVRRGEDLAKFSGSLYAPTFGFWEGA